ncbi:MAG: purine-nucleoside phosphorylase [Candidatus Wallbacteria bacterium HGW-Wallbacteria-1]|jgi:purine-nucleoside phosphorylase|uniref:Uridine phosphorylase n=1 Tax=Candidatus Wallbacteria bacterium HGW-Wallbacteria-1 TaxID=2013854 RepID=A0A2N1PRY6_9BACT|nr:MAG: purine-nucleoside phosphorylase [Candidatus Wallbacteria bacterium HGW-Wallbacteria-1]
MSLHIEALKGEIAPRVLLPGDPVRARIMAERFLEAPFCYNRVRGMFGFTGKYRGMDVSIQATGMGMPSASIYVNELLDFYDVRTLIRIGTCGSINENVQLRDLILAMSASTDSAINNGRFNGRSYAPTCDFTLLSKAWALAAEMGLPSHAGSVMTSDLFYHYNSEDWKLWAKYNVLAIEMETAEIYTLAAAKGARALSILTVSDSIVHDQLTSSEERENSFINMALLALETAVSQTSD